MSERPVNDVEWPKDEDYVPDPAEIDYDDEGPGGDAEYEDDYDPHAWLNDDDDDDDYGDDGEGAAAF